MLKIYIIGCLLLSACHAGKPDMDCSAEAAQLCTGNTPPVNGVWEVYNREYETFFICIDNDSMFFLKGPAEKYYFRHDTLNIEGGGMFTRKIIATGEKELIWVGPGGDTLRLRRKSEFNIAASEE